MRRRFMVMAALTVASVAALGLGAAAWCASGVIGRLAIVPRRHPRPPDVRVAALADGKVTLQATGARDERGRARHNLTKPGVWGLEWTDGYARVGDVVSNDATGSRVVRSFTPINGSPAVGTTASLDQNAYPADPTAALGLACEQVTFPSPLGPMPAWRTDGHRDTWAILLHGRNARRAEMLRMLRPVAELGYPALVTAYRNDPDAPDGTTSWHLHGQTEWEDLEAAVRFVLDQGARDVVLGGISMGGAIIMGFLRNSALAGSARGVILDSPVLDLGAIVESVAHRIGAPDFLTRLSMRVASLRYGVDWTAIDYVAGASTLDVPVLLIHGVEDAQVPVAISDAFAASRPDLVTYERLEAADHVGSWNIDSERYEAAIRLFLERVAE